MSRRSWILCGCLLLACKAEDTPPPLASAVIPVASAPLAPPSASSAPARAQALYEAIRGKGLSDALIAVRSDLKEQTGQASVGAGALARWANEGLRWTDLMAIPETTRGETLKDIATVRGRRICTSGQVTEISIDRTGTPVITWGTMRAGPDALSLLVGGSTRGIVRNSVARFCGIVAELNTYENTGGGTTTSVVLVGMFDLPENKTSAAGR